jgi:aconitate hydratase
VQVDVFGKPSALDENVAIEFGRNQERYSFLRWGQKAFQTTSRWCRGDRHRAPGEPRAPGARGHGGAEGRRVVLFPDTVYGTDSTPR